MRTARILRTLYLSRVLFAVAWVILVTASAPSTRGDDQATLLIGCLLVVYPASDAIASIFDIRADRLMPTAWHYVNLIAGGLTPIAVAGPRNPTPRPKETTIMPSRRNVLGLGAAALSMLALTDAGRPDQPAAAPPTAPVRPPFVLQPATVPAGYVCDC